MKRYDLVMGREYTTSGGETKTAWVKLGSMFERDNGGFSLTFDALPTPQLRDGKLEVRVMAFEPRDREQQPQRQAHASGSGGGFGDVPF